MPRTFPTRWLQGKFLCLELDPSPKRMPPAFRRHLRKKHRDPAIRGEDVSYGFLRAVVDATHAHVGAYILNRARFDALDPDEALNTLIGVVLHIREVAPCVPVILDMKCGDTEEVNHLHARFAFKDIKADAVTVNAGFGFSPLEPFLRQKNALAFVAGTITDPASTALLIYAAQYTTAGILLDMDGFPVETHGLASIIRSSKSVPLLVMRPPRLDLDPKTAPEPLRRLEHLLQLLTEPRTGIVLVDGTDTVFRTPSGRTRTVASIARAAEAADLRLLTAFKRADFSRDGAP